MWKTVYLLTIAPAPAVRRGDLRETRMDFASSRVTASCGTLSSDCRRRIPTRFARPRIQVLLERMAPAFHIGCPPSCSKYPASSGVAH